MKQSDLDNFHAELKKLGFDSPRQLFDAIIAGTFTASTPSLRVLSNEIVNMIKHDLLTSEEANVPVRVEGTSDPDLGKDELIVTR